MIIEGIVTTTGPDGSMHVAAMGPTVDEAERRAASITRLVLRPFATSQTATNLVARPQGVFHLSDDVLLLARIVVGAAGDLPARPAVPRLQPRRACRRRGGDPRDPPASARRRRGGRPPRRPFRARGEDRWRKGAGGVRTAAVACRRGAGRGSIMMAIP